MGTLWCVEKRYPSIDRPELATVPQQNGGWTSIGPFPKYAAAFERYTYWCSKARYSRKVGQGGGTNYVCRLFRRLASPTKQWT